ncbi:MAG: 5-formyltetrahydrofolate cyclo-ligase [Cyanobacteriota bacterium]|nr:5-formyltetrahydrofolate cyclo-ligase [Cyanobacteriota bacterium]
MAPPAVSATPEPEGPPTLPTSLPQPESGPPPSPDPPPSPGVPPRPASADRKAALRRHFRQRRRQAVIAAPDALTAAAISVVPTLTAPPLRLGLYWPIGHEPDLRPLAERLPFPWRDHLALPAIRGDQLLYLPWQPGDPLAPDAVGIPAPTTGLPLRPAQLGLLLVPALAADPSGLRLGSGGGWYDRLRSDPLWEAVPALVVVPAACVAPRLPCDPWDVPFPGRLEESGLQWSNPSVATS